MELAEVRGKKSNELGLFSINGSFFLLQENRESKVMSTLWKKFDSLMKTGSIENVCETYLSI